MSIENEIRKDNPFEEILKQLKLTVPFDESEFKVITPVTEKTENEYDDEGKIIKTVFTDKSGKCLVTDHIYDSIGLLIRSESYEQKLLPPTDEEKAVTTIKYDKLGRIVEINGPVRDEIRIYNEDGITIAKKTKDNYSSDVTTRNSEGEIIHQLDSVNGEDVYEFICDTEPNCFGGKTDIINGLNLDNEYVDSLAKFKYDERGRLRSSRCMENKRFIVKEYFYINDESDELDYVNISSDDGKQIDTIKYEYFEDGYKASSENYLANLIHKKGYDVLLESKFSDSKIEETKLISINDGPYVILSEFGDSREIEYWDDDNNTNFVLTEHGSKYDLTKCSIKTENKRYKFLHVEGFNSSTVEMYDGKENLIVSETVDTISTNIKDYIMEKVVEFIKDDDLLVKILKEEVNVSWQDLQ